MHHLAYRPDIDGLRTFAVFAVIFYHANFYLFGQNPIKGGFLGVDIFFVISGYLITSILLTGFETKNLTLMNFYERRARRILPILLFSITVSIPLSWFLLLPSEFQQYSWQTLSSIFSVSNFYFWKEDSYWAVQSILKPFLHTWSLGVEEQFYLLTPLLLLFIINQKLRQIRYVFLTLAIVSLLASHYVSIKHAQSSFYLLPFRAWELLIGASIATVRDRNLANLKFPYFPTVGLAVLLVCFFVFDENTLHPSFYTLIPTLGVGLIIFFANAKDPTTKLLSNRVMTSIGLISYGLYVWHFPVFSYLSHAEEFQNPGTKICAIGIVFLLSISTYFLIEKPFRSFRLVKTKVFWSILSLWITILTSFAYWGLQDGFRYRFPELVNIPSKPELIQNHKWLSNDVSSSDRIILVGDSHIEAIAPMFMRWALNTNRNFALSGFGGCQLILNMNRVAKVNFAPVDADTRWKCDVALQNYRMKFITESKPSIVVIGGRLPLVVEEDRFNNMEGGYEGEMIDFLQDEKNSLLSISERQTAIRENYILTVQKILDAGHTVVLLYPIPEVGIHVPKTLLKRLDGKYFLARDVATQNPVTTSYKVFEKRAENSVRILDSIKGDNVFRIIPSKIFCEQTSLGRCVTHNSEVSFYRDDDHLSEYGADLILREFKKLISSRDFNHRVSKSVTH
ncbi:MAG: acyltransferase family protein [Betaproteobacteria bacterium]